MVEFKAWHTPFENGDLAITECRYGDGGFEYRSAKGKGISLPPSHDGDKSALAVKLVCLDQLVIYAVHFRFVHAFRVLDEGGLQEIWAASDEQGGRPAMSTFKVRNHGWSAESPIPFFQAGSWSYLIASNNDCVEVLCREEPQILRIGSVEEYDIGPSDFPAR